MTDWEMEKRVPRPPDDCIACCGETNMYSQCRLEREVEGGVMKQVAWIPAEYGVVGKVVKIRDRQTNEWENGWRVTAAGKPKPGVDHVGCGWAPCDRPWPGRYNWW